MFAPAANAESGLADESAGFVGQARGRVTSELRRRWIGRASTALLVTCIALLPSHAFAQVEDDIDDVLGGFDEEIDAAPRRQPDAERAGEPMRFFRLSGDLSLGSSYNYRQHQSPSGTRYGNLSRLRTQLDLQLDLDLPHAWKARVEGRGFYDFAYLAHGRSNFTDDVLDDYEWDIDFREVWIQGSPLESLDLKLGRQIVNWGRSDSLRVLDVINPLDNREPGLVDIEDLRIPLTMVRLDYYPSWLDDWSVQLLVIPEYENDQNPSFGSDFNPLPAPPPDLDTPRTFGSAPEYGGSLHGVFPGWDLSFYVARLYENTRLAVGGLKGSSHVTLVGSGGNRTFGSWLLKAELAWFYGVEYLRPPGQVDKSRLDVMGGVEYYGFDDIQIAFEVVNRHIFDYDRGMKPFRKEDELESALRVTLDLLNERLHMTALGFVLGAHAQNGSVVRLEANYDLRDALAVGGGLVLYQEGDNPAFDQIGKNDRLFLRIEYSF